MPLTNTAIRNARSGRLSDSGGLYVLMKGKGKGWWRLDYRVNGTRKTLSMGVYPDVSLKLARNRRDVARDLLANGIDPSSERHATKVAQSNSFEAVAREWFTKQSPTWVPSHSSRIIRRLERDMFPWLGRNPISSIKAPELLRVLRRIEERGAIETAHRALNNCGQVFRYAVATGRADRDPSNDLKGALAPVKQRHLPSITEPKAIGALLRSIDAYEGTFVTKCALRFAPLVFVRPGELRHAEWSELDLKKKEWRIPAHKMKGNRTHIVPLSRQANALLKDIQPLTGSGKYVFPSVRSDSRPMSENTVNEALRRLGYSKDEMTGHGFRSMASTLLNEQGWNRDAIERQLAHAERSAVRAAYNYAEHLPERRKMMQAWADYLDSLVKG